MIENSEKDLADKSNDKNEIQKSTKAQAEII